MLGAIVTNPIYKNDLMKKSWQKIEGWININHPTMIETLNLGATNQELFHLETILGNRLPEDFKAFLSIHNGQTWTHLKLFNGDRLLAIEDIINDWTSWNTVLPDIDTDCKSMFGEAAKSSPQKGIKDDWWNPSWVPITSDGSGDSFCIDLDPTSEGTIGQIIRMYHDDPERTLVSSSFSEWIYNYIEDLENNVYEPSDDIGWGGIVKKGY